MAGKFSYKAEEGLECVRTVGGSIEAGVVMKRSYADTVNTWREKGKASMNTRHVENYKVGWLIG
jgi:hypothetical protein